MTTYVGESIPRNDGYDKATGCGKFTADIYLPHMLYAKAVRSPYAHAKVLSIDTSEAEALPGVKAIVTWENTKHIPFNTSATMVTTNPPEEPIRDQYIVTNEPLYIGDEVAAVAATSEAIAEQAVKLISVEYEELPAVYDPLEAIKPEAVTLHPEIGKTEVNNACGVVVHIDVFQGDLEEHFKNCDHVVETDIELPRVKQCQMETHGAVADYKNGRLDVWCTTQTPHPTKMILAYALDMPESKVHVQNPPYVGGGFGVRIGISGKAEIIAAALAIEAHAPVKFIYTRAEDMLCSDTRHGGYLHCRLGANKNGKFMAMDTTAWLNTGAYATFGIELLGVCGACGTQGTYYIPANRYTGYPVYTNQETAGAFRGFGTPQGTAIVEAAVDKMAQVLGMDPIELRHLNTRREENPLGFWPFPVGSIGVDECLDRAALAIGWKEKRGRKQSGNIRRGVGIACGTHVSNAAPFCVDYNAIVMRLEQDGSLFVSSGIPEIGPGSTTALMQVACDLVGVPFESAVMQFGDTAAGPFDIGSHATRTLYTVGYVMSCAVKKLRADIFDFASKMMEVPAEELDLKDGIVFGGGKEMTIKKLAYQAHLRGHQFIASECQIPPNSLPWFAQAAEVEVDMELGLVKVLKVAAAHDVGHVVNPALCESQVEGGVAQGVGYATREEMTYVEGKGFYNDGFHKYMLPTADDICEIETILVESRDPYGVYNIKGVGECGAIPTVPAVLSAVEDATGVRFEACPLVPGRVLSGLKKAGLVK